MSETTYPEPALFLEGRWVAGDEQGPEVVDPVSGTVLARTPGAGGRQVDAAITAAARAFPTWAALPGKERGDVLRTAADHLAGTVDADAAVMTLEQGKTLTESRAEMLSIVELFRWFADRVEAGTVGVNTGVIVHHDSPLSGIKDSGYGSDGGLEGMHEFRAVKSVSSLPTTTSP